MKIQESLSLALRHLRLADEERTLWIDCLSINQGDLQECGFEVGRMSEIYNHRAYLVVWLGTSSENSKGAISTLKAYAGEFEFTRTCGSLPYPDSSYRTFSYPNCARIGSTRTPNTLAGEKLFLSVPVIKFLDRLRSWKAPQIMSQIGL
ncbi:hypothetical protein ACSS6W_000032 [Trichoderma asperelloides]